MMANHHPSDETLRRLSDGTLESGPRIVVAVHVGGCPHCAELVAEFEAIGGAALDEVAPVDMSDTAYEHLMARVDAWDGKADADTIAVPRRAELGIRLPEALDGCGVGPWRWIGPGVRWSKLEVPGDPQANLMLLKVAAGRKLPEHTHSGREYTQVLSGSFADERGRYRPGDMDEADSDVQHQPIVDVAGECVCLAALEGHMRLRGFFGRMIQPLLGG